MSAVLVMNENWVHSDFLNAFSYSSQVAALPATNVYDKLRRAKVWRTAGCWEITSSNNVIIFRETASTNITATIAVATYTTDATFLTAIKTALEALGDSTYTVTRDTSTNKIKITSNGSGGTGLFKLMWTNASSTAYSILGFDNSSDDTGALTYTADTLKIHTSEWLVFDLGTASLPQAVSLIGTVNGLGLTSAATVYIQANSSDAWTSPAYSQALEYNADAMGYFSTTGLGTVAYRYWRLLITDASNPDGYLEISKVYLGELFSASQGSVQFPLNFGFNELSTVQVSEFGSIFSTVKPTSDTFSLSWFGLSKADCESLVDFIKIYGKSYPFWITMDPDEAFSTSFQRWIKFVRFSNEPTFTLVSPNNFSASWPLSEEV